MSQNQFGSNAFFVRNQGTSSKDGLACNIFFSIALGKVRNVWLINNTNSTVFAHISEYFLLIKAYTEQ
jgi:hypothetical protein